MKHLLLIILLIVSSGLAAQIKFTDVTANKLINSYASADTHGSGVSLVDIDNDEDLDLYLPTERNEPNLFYRNNGDGTFAEIGGQIGLSDMQRGRMALFFDYNGDGLLDVIIGDDCDFDDVNCENSQQLRFYRNENGVFSEVSDEVGLSGFGPIKNNQVLGGMSAGDINNDGYIDFVVAVRNGPLLLFRNNEGRDFEEVSSLLGINSNDLKYYQPVIFDINEDGLADIYCNVDFGRNALYINQGNVFRDRARDTNSDNSFNEMGIAIGDFDNDTDFDVYATNIENYLGEDVHNILLENKLEETDILRFSEASKDLGVHSGGWGWGATFLDADNDGLLDLVTTNGWDLPFEVIDQSKFWRNNGGSFSDLSKESGFADSLNAASLIAGDIDRDGDLDLIQTLKGENQPAIPLRILENQTVSENNFLVVKPRMIGRNRFAVGSIVRSYVQNEVYSRAVIAGSSFYGQEPNEAFFGLGQHLQVDSIEIVWPGGEKSKFYGIQANQIITLSDDDIIHRPSNLMASPDGYGVLLTWDDYASNETAYILERSENSSFSEFEFFQLNANTEGYFDSTAAANSIYNYRLKAVNSEFASKYTRVIEVNTIVVGVSSESGSIKLFPNPASAANPSIHLKSPSPIETIELYTPSGKKIDFTINESAPGQKIIRLLKPYQGLVFVKIEGQTFRLIIN